MVKRLFLGVVGLVLTMGCNHTNSDKVAEYKSGKDKLFGFFVGQVMKEGKGAFNPSKVNELLKSRLG